jgi:chemotaxis protein MotB
MKLDELKERQSIHEQNPFFISFADLMVVLATFFVMFISMSKVDIGQFEKVRAGFSGSTKGTLVELANSLKKSADKVRGVSVELADDGVRLDLDSVALFSTGSATLKTDALQPLEPLLAQITNSRYSIDVEGHTDDRAYYRIDQGGLENNWTLSGRRSAAVVNYLLSKGIAEERLRIVGYASNKPKVLFKGKTDQILEGARARNRRVTLLIK